VDECLSGSSWKIHKYTHTHTNLIRKPTLGPPQILRDFTTHVDPDPDIGISPRHLLTGPPTIQDRELQER
jgi:hypothetical protein